MKRQSYSFYGYYYFVTMANDAAALGPRLFYFVLKSQEHSPHKGHRDYDISFFSLISVTQNKRQK
jgi:hypothetical protein